MSTKKEDEGYRSKADRINSSRKGRRKKKQRRDAILIGGILVFVLVVAVFGVSAFMKVAFIQVENEGGVYTEEQIVSAAEIKIGESLMRIGKKSVSDRLCRSLPYIGAAEVKISIPDTVVISVTYTEASLCVRIPNGYALLDRSGKVLQTNVSVPPDRTAELIGVSLTGAVPGEYAEFEDPDMFKHVTGLASALKENEIEGVTSLNFTDLANIVVELNYNTDVKLGPIAKAAGKLAFGKEVIRRTMEQARSSGSKLVIDLTVEDSAFVRSQDKIDEASESRYNAEHGIETTAVPPDDSADAQPGGEDADDTYEEEENTTAAREDEEEGDAYDEDPDEEDGGEYDGEAGYDDDSDADATAAVG